MANNNNNNKLILISILIKIITDGNLTLTKRLIKNCTYIINVKKERVGLGGSRMGTKENDFKSGKTVFIGMLRKKIGTYCYSEIFFP
jgi:hypothetical protein